MSEIQSETNTNPPAFNVPGVILAIAAAFVIIHVLRSYVLSQDGDYIILLLFAFFPATYSVAFAELITPLSLIWSPITHGFLHANWTHLAVNTVWMLAFGSAAARRFGTVRFLIFMAMATAAGAVAHYIFHPSGVSPVIGASGAVSGCMGAVVRFALGFGGNPDQTTRQPALSLFESLKNRNIMTFVIVWFVLNWLFGTGIIPLDGNQNIAWEAHMGGFLFGWLGFSFFDPER